MKKIQKVAFTMQLLPGTEIEYKKRHDEIWPELEELLRESGIYDYSIFLDDATGVLFGIHSLRDNHASDRLSSEKIMQKWWAYMSDLMETNEDLSPIVNPLREVFYME